MSHAHDLLSLAERYDLTATEAEKRRCISTAYYAVFHLLIESLVQRLMPGDSPYAQNMARRALAHTTLKDVCYSLKQSPNAPPAWKEAGYEEPVDRQLAELATRVVDLHKWREYADYDLPKAVWQADAERQLDRAREVFAMVRAGLAEPQWTLFFASLLFKGRK